jgi:hypothetical protein
MGVGFRRADPKAIRALGSNKTSDILNAYSKAISIQYNDAKQDIWTYRYHSRVTSIYLH